MIGHEPLQKNNKKASKGHMEMEPMTCRPFTFCLALLGLLALPVFAAGTADDLLAVHQMRLATQKSLNAFFMYVGQEATPA